MKISEQICKNKSLKNSLNSEHKSEYKSQNIHIIRLNPISNYTQCVKINCCRHKHKKIILPNNIKTMLLDESELFMPNIIPNNIKYLTTMLCSKKINTRKIIELRILHETFMKYKFIITNTINMHSLSMSHLYSKIISKLECIHYLQTYFIDTNNNILHLKNVQNSLNSSKICFYKSVHTIILNGYVKNIIFFKNIYKLEIYYYNSLHAKYNLCNVYDLNVADTEISNIMAIKNIHTLHINVYSNDFEQTQYLKNICNVMLLINREVNLSVLDTVRYLSIYFAYVNKIDEYTIKTINIRYTNLSFH